MIFLKSFSFALVFALLAGCASIQPNSDQLKSELETISESAVPSEELDLLSNQSFLSTWNENLASEGKELLTKYKKEVDEFNGQIKLSLPTETTPANKEKPLYIVHDMVLCEPGCKKITPVIRIDTISVIYGFDFLYIDTHIFKIGEETREIKFKSIDSDSYRTDEFGLISWELDSYALNESDIEFFAKSFTNDSIKLKVYGENGTAEIEFLDQELEDLQTSLLVYRYIINENIQIF
jgi:hypothetical protein